MNLECRLVLTLIFFVGLLVGCSNSENDEKQGAEVKAVPAIGYKIEASYPHDSTSFTEGLLFHEGKLYESTGSPEDMTNTRSVVGLVNLESGKLTVKAQLDRKKYFGEGISFLNSKLYWLTYKTKEGFIYDANTFMQTGKFTFPSSEGWGMTTDGVSLIMSDGTGTLTYLDPETFKVKKFLEVRDQNWKVNLLNELEFMNGQIYANVYTTNEIFRIDTATGAVLGKLDLTAIVEKERKRSENALEMNGIAFEPSSGSFYITGKMWSSIYKIKLKN